MFFKKEGNMSAVAIKKDPIDLSVNYFTNAKPREFFKGLHQIFFWNKHITGKDAVAFKTALAAFSKVFDAFNFLDLMDNLNNLRNYFFKKDVKDLSLLLSDTANSAAETTLWLSATTGIVSLSVKAISYTSLISGATLMFSFVKYAYNDITELLSKPLNNDQKNVKMLCIAKDIALFAIGALVFISCFGLPLMVPMLATCGAITVISNYAIYMIENTDKVLVS